MAASQHQRPCLHRPLLAQRSLKHRATSARAVGVKVPVTAHVRMVGVVSGAADATVSAVSAVGADAMASAVTDGLKDVETAATKGAWKDVGTVVLKDAASRAATTHATTRPCQAMTTPHLAVTSVVANVVRVEAQNAVASAVKAAASVAQTVNARHVNRVAVIAVRAMAARWHSLSFRLPTVVTLRHQSHATSVATHAVSARRAAIAPSGHLGVVNAVSVAVTVANEAASVARGTAMTTRQQAAHRLVMASPTYNKSWLWPMVPHRAWLRPGRQPMRLRKLTGNAVNAGAVTAMVASGANGVSAMKAASAT